MVLFLDTHLSDIVAILYANGIILKEKTLKKIKEHSTILMPTIIDLIDGVKLDSIIVVNGPGSFTSVRLGVTIAKTLAYTLNIPIRTVTYLECMAISSDIKRVAFNDNNGYYVGKFDDKNNKVEDYKYIKNKDFEEINDSFITNIIVDYKKVIEFALQKENINPHLVNPIYVKKLDVEK